MIQPIFRIIKPDCGKRRFTFEVDVSKNTKDLNFICQCQARVHSEKVKHLLELVELPIRLIKHGGK